MPSNAVAAAVPREKEPDTQCEQWAVFWIDGDDDDGHCVAVGGCERRRRPSRRLSLHLKKRERE